MVISFPAAGYDSVLSLDVILLIAHFHESKKIRISFCCLISVLLFEG